MADVFLPQRLGAVQVGRPPQRHALFHAARVCKTGCNVIYKSCVVKTATAKRSLAWRGCTRQCFVWPLGCLCALTLASASRVPPLRPMPTPLQGWCRRSTGRACPFPLSSNLSPPPLSLALSPIFQPQRRAHLPSSFPHAPALVSVSFMLVLVAAPRLRLRGGRDTWAVKCFEWRSCQFLWGS